MVIWSDNTGAEAATRQGSAQSFDHLSLVHAIWLRAAELGLSLYVKRVPTKDNIADDPSRERQVTQMFICSCAISPVDRYSLLEKIPNMNFVEAHLDEVFQRAQTWEALSVLGVFKK